MKKRQQDYTTVESYSMMTVKLMRQPINQSLEIKRTGERYWIDEQIFAEASLQLSVDDEIMLDCKPCTNIYSGKRYRVMDRVDWSQFGYMEYKVKSDYK